MATWQGHNRPRHHSHHIFNLKMDFGLAADGNVATSRSAVYPIIFLLQIDSGLMAIGTITPKNSHSIAHAHWSSLRAAKLQVVRWLQKKISAKPKVVLQTDEI
jgi:hypothetical protein